MKTVFISILNFNGKINTLECIESLKKINTSGFNLTIVVIDNGSSEKFDLKESSDESIRFKFIRSKDNLGFSGGHNLGIKYALSKGADYIVILNNDTYADKNFLEEILKVAEKDEKIGILAPKIYFAPGYEFHKEKYKENELGKVFWYAGGKMDWKNVIGHHRGVDLVDKGQFDEVEETELVTGCCMMIKKEVLGKVGMFDERYYLYYEDSDLNIRAKKEGFKIIYVPKAVIFHKNAGSAGGSGSKLQDYYITRNRLIFAMKYASIRAKFALFRESLKILFTGRFWQKRGVLDFYLRRLGKGSYKI